MIGWVTGIIGISVAGAAAYAVKRGRRRREQKRLKSRIYSCLGKHLAIDGSWPFRLIGNGNTGCVFSCRTDDNLLHKLGLGWRTSLPFPDQIAVKFSAFQNAAHQAELLTEMAQQIEATMASSSSLAVCPFLGIGLFPAQAPVHDQFVVEIMPLLNGVSLRQVMVERSSDGLHGSMQMDGLHKTSHLVSQLKSILSTVQFFEQHGYFSRSVDPDNIIILPEGNWVRIDFDRVVRTGKFPRARMRRICEVAWRTLKMLPEAAQLTQQTGLSERLKYTMQRSPDRNVGLYISNPVELLDPEQADRKVL